MSMAGLLHLGFAVHRNPNKNWEKYRLLISSRQDWEDHLPAHLRQREKLRPIGLIA